MTIIILDTVRLTHMSTQDIFLSSNPMKNFQRVKGQLDAAAHARDIFFEVLCVSYHKVKPPCHLVHRGSISPRVFIVVKNLVQIQHHPKRSSDLSNDRDHQ